MHFHEPAISFLSINPKELCIYSPKHTKGYFHQHDPFVSQTGNYSNEQTQKLKKSACGLFVYGNTRQQREWAVTGKMDGADKHDAEQNRRLKGGPTVELHFLKGQKQLKTNMWY